MPLFLANPSTFLKECTNFKMGAKQVKKLYQGTKLVWEDFKGFTFEGTVSLYYRIIYVALEQTDVNLYKNLYAAVGGVDRLIWTSGSGYTLEVDTSRNRLEQYDSNRSRAAYTFLDSGVALTRGATYTFKVQLL